MPAGQNTTTYSYDAASNVATVTYPNGVVSSFVYDNLNRLKNAPISKGSTIANYTYELEPAGNRQSATELSGQSVNWTYDGIYRLTQETIGSDPAPSDARLRRELLITTDRAHILETGPRRTAVTPGTRPTGRPAPLI